MRGGFSASITRRRFLAGICIALCVGAASAQLANPKSNRFNDIAAHKLHLSVTQLDYNQKSQSVEIVLRVYADDLENAVSQHAKRPIKIDPTTANKDKRTGEAILAYLRNGFELKSPSGTRVKLAWVGMELQMDMYWLRLEGKMSAVPANTNGLDGAQLKNKVFCELFADQVNIVNTKIREKQVGLMFEAKDDFKVITDRAMNKQR